MADVQNTHLASVFVRRPGDSGARTPADRYTIGVVTALAVAALVAPTTVVPELRLVWNVTASVPLGLYRIDTSRRPHVGDLAAVCPSLMLAQLMAQRHYVESNALLVKPVAAVAGAQVCRWRLVITINGHRRASALDHDRLRRPLQRWSGCRTLASGEYFLLAPNVPASFDSRYFGPVAATSVLGLATPLWVWS